MCHSTTEQLQVVTDSELANLRTLSSLFFHRAEARTDEESNLTWMDDGSRPVLVPERVREWPYKSVSCCALRSTIGACVFFSRRWWMVTSAEERKNLHGASGHSVALKCLSFGELSGPPTRKEFSAKLWIQSEDCLWFIFQMQASVSRTRISETQTESV